MRSNIRTRKLQKGGYECELDVLGYRPTKGGGEVVHIETSGDYYSWAKRKKRFLTKKFILSDKEYEEILGVKVKTLTRIAVVGQSRNPKVDTKWGKGIKVWSIPKFLGTVTEGLRNEDFMSAAVPEGYPILRTIQMMVYYKVLAEPGS